MAKDSKDRTEPGQASGGPAAPPAASSKPKRPPDPEFRALHRIDAILTELDQSTACRVLHLLHGRYVEKVPTMKLRTDEGQ